METLFFIVIAIAGLHFLYESVILPSITLKIKYKFVKLKDEVIMMAIDKKIDLEEAKYVMHSIDISSRNIQYMTLSTIINAKNFFSKNEDVKKESTLNKIKNERLKQIHTESVKYLFKALVFNSLMWAVYVVPLCIVIGAYGRTISTYKRLIDKINTTSEKDFDKVIHGGEYCPS
jgi:hypothetical protein